MNANPIFQLENFDLRKFSNILNLKLSPLGLEAIPFNVRWYNDFRLKVASERPQLILTDNPRAVGIVVISNGIFFDQVIQRSDPFSPRTDFVDSTVDYHINELLKCFDSEMSVTCCNTDRPPYYHVQSIGYVAAIDEFIDGRAAIGILGEYPPNLQSEYIPERDENLWGSIKSKVLNVNIHPRYGGWYAYRMLFVLHSVSWPEDIQQSAPLKFLSDNEKKTVIKEYNKYPDLARWRDFHDIATGPIQRYKTHQYLFFHETSIEKRRRILQLLKQESLVQSN